MSFQTCWRCLSKASDPALNPLRAPQQSWLLFPASTAPFTISASLLALPPKKKGRPAMTEKLVRGAKQTFTKKKKKPTDTNKGRKPAPGERKALRKRVVLSNTNALEVHGLQDVSAESITNDGLKGQVLGIPGPIVDRLRAVEAFKVPQGWALFRRPAMLMRKETLEFGKEMEGIAQNEEKKSIRRVYVGERGSGKTLMLLQAMTMAFLKDWVVINIPNAQDLILAQTEYAPLPSTTNPTLYTQRTYTAALLSSISRSNPILTDLQLSQPASTSDLPIPIPPNISLSRLALLGASDPETAWPIFQLLLTELKKPGRPPLTLCLDGLAHVMCNTRYISAPKYQPIHAHDFTIIKFFLDHLSGAEGLPNGGAVLAATSNSNNPVIPTLNLALSQLEGNQAVQRDPFAKYDERVLDVFNKGGVEVQRIGGITKEDARALMEYWARSGVCRQKVDEGFVGEKWSLSGGGVVGELERAVLRMRI
ncbi:hypothetical protein OEA41_004243 [Lepraria neglecta]|uniref:Small ribosomal subunit protein mS29 n=1 Tax=Lepraria neglecta TaxID=209136 RepID=A0AAD9Z0N5_9LECA|nr:hypothetical protein OEA41_004243 [Lepraria neglecta]